MIEAILMPGHEYNYTYISEEQLNTLSSDFIQTLMEKHKISYSFNVAADKLAFLNQLLDLAYLQVFDPSLHRALLNLLTELFSADPIFSAHSDELKALLKMKLPDQDSLIKNPDDDVTDRFIEIGDNVNEFIQLKSLNPELTYKQLLCLWIYENLSQTALASNKTVATVLVLADSYLKEKEFEKFSQIISELALCFPYHKEVEKFKFLLSSLNQTVMKKPDEVKDISPEQHEKIEKKLNQFKTPLAILDLLKQKGFQTLGTDYCRVIVALVSTYLLIHHLVVIHDEQGLTLDELKNEFFLLIHADASKFNSGGDIASDIINAFYQSDFYKDGIKNKDYDGKYTIEGIIDFQDGKSFNKSIKTNATRGQRCLTQSAEINQLHGLLNIALINLLQNKTNNVFKIKPIMSNSPRTDLLQTLSLGNGWWSGMPHVVIQLKEGIVNAPAGFQIIADGFWSMVNGFAFQPTVLISEPVLINKETFHEEKPESFHEEKPKSVYEKISKSSYEVEAKKHQGNKHKKEKQNKPEEEQISRDFHQEFNDVISTLQGKMEDFQSRPDYETNLELQKAYNAAKNLHIALEDEGNNFFAKEPSQENYEQFKLHCKKHIKDARDVLNDHRGWNKILVNVLAIVLSAGVGYAIAAGINIAVKGRFTLFDTDSSEKLSEIEDHIERNKVIPHF